MIIIIEWLGKRGRSLVDRLHDVCTANINSLYKHFLYFETHSNLTLHAWYVHENCYKSV